MIKKDNVTFRAFEGDYEPAELYAGGNKAAGYVSESAQGQELELSNTYNDSYEDLKVFGKSEQKAKWYQAERAIEAGSYQVSAESGIYEVTISDDLIDADDTNKDRICFDSVSGIGYRENMRNGVKTRTSLTFTKVESSTLPVLPWTAYGKQLIPFEPYTTNGTGSTTKDWPAPPFVLGETYYFGGGVCDDGTAINSNNSAFIILKDGVQVYNKSPNRAITITEDLLGADTVRLYTNSSLVGKTVTQFTGELGSSYSGSYEPFNPTPPESLTPTPDYPQQIYDLSDVTVTSRGRNLFDETTYPCVFNGNQTTNYKIDINAKTAGAYTLYCVISGMDGIVYSSAGGLISVEIGYSDSTIKWDSLATSSSAVNDVIIINTNADKKLSYVRIWKHDRFTGGTITLKNVSILEGTYTADTLPPFDKYRYTGATIPLRLGAVSDDKDYLLCGGNAVKKYQHIRQFELDGDTNRCWLNNYGSVSNPYCHYFIRIGNGFDVCKFGTTGKTSHGFQITVLGESYDYMAYIHIPWSVLGFTSVPSTSEANDAANRYCASQKALGTPVAVQYVLNTPVETEITDTWAQDMIGLKTAPYWTKIYTDKETGGQIGRAHV